MNNQCRHTKDYHLSSYVLEGKIRNEFLAVPTFLDKRQTADLVFAPTLACWSFCYPEMSSHYSLSRVRIPCPAGLTSKPHRAQKHFGSLTWIALPATGIDFQPQT